MLTFILVSCPFFRAQKRVAQQRIESKIPLQQLNDIRKKVFSEVKVSTQKVNLGAYMLNAFSIAICKPRLTNRR